MHKKKNDSPKNKISEYLKSPFGTFISFLFGVLITALISTFVTKACNKLVPDAPIVVEKVPDTINIVHVYEPIDSISNAKDENVVNAEVKKRVARNKSQYTFSVDKVNRLMKNVSFPNAEGYTPCSAAPYFTLEMTDLNQPYVDFIFHFFNEEVLADIYCLNIKIFKAHKDGGRVYVLNEYYTQQKGTNIIRLNNIFTSSNYEIEAGFIFTGDRNAKYPNFYREVKVVNNIK